MGNFKIITSLVAFPVTMPISFLPFLCFLLVLTYSWNPCPRLRSTVKIRLRGKVRIRGADLLEENTSDIIAELVSLIRNGSSLISVCEEVGGCGFAVPEITEARLRQMLLQRSSSHPKEVKRISQQLSASCHLSTALGCGAASCLEAVEAEHKRNQGIEDRRRSALAVPRMTLRVLLVLPILILLAGQMASSHTFTVLFTKPVGWICLLIAALLYGTGLMWIRSLIHHFDENSLG